MKYESLLTVDEHNKWLDLEVTLGTNEVLINQDLSRLSSLFNKFTDTEKTILLELTQNTIDLNIPLNINNNSALLKLLLIKKFIDQFGLSVIREAMSEPDISEKEIFLNIADKLLTHNEYPEQIYVYAIYRQRGSPNTWLKVIGDLSSDEIEQKIDNGKRALQMYINSRLNVSRKFKFRQQIGDLTIFIFSKPTTSKVIKAENRNVEVQRATHTIIILDRAKNKIGVVTGSKKEILLIQRYLRYRIFPDSIGVPRSEVRMDKKLILRNILVSDTTRGIDLNSVSLATTQLPGQPALKLKATEGNSLDQTLSLLDNSVWSNIGVDSLKSLDYRIQGRNLNVYSYGDDWKRAYLNISAKRRSSLLESVILDYLNEKLGYQIKETCFIIENLTDTEILEKLFNNKKVLTSPPIPEQVEKLIVRLVSEKIIHKPKKMSRRRCSHCYTLSSWNKWECPSCDRETMIIVGEEVRIEPNEKSIISRLGNFFKSDYPNCKITLTSNKQRKNYKKPVIRIYNPTKNLSTYILFVGKKRDLSFTRDLSQEGFGIVAVIDPEMLEKSDELVSMGCDLVNLSSAVERIVNNTNPSLFSPLIANQERKVLERIFSNSRTSLNRLDNKPATYDEDMFEVDITNLFQAIVPDVTRLGTEYKGVSVPDGYCCYGYRSTPFRKKRRLFGWDAKYSFSSSYRLGSADLNKQKKYVKWLTKIDGEPAKMGSLGVYAFISNFDSVRGFKTVLSNISRWSGFPKQCRLMLIQDQLIVKIGEWILDHWQQVINNNSLTSEIIFKFFRRKRGKFFNILTIANWNSLERELDQAI